MFLQRDGRWGKCHAAVQTVAPIHPATPRQTYPFSDRACPTALTSGFMPKFQCNGCILYPPLTASTSSGTLSPNPHFPACFHAETRIMHHSNYHPCSKTRGKVSDTHHSWRRFYCRRWPCGVKPEYLTNFYARSGVYHHQYTCMRCTHMGWMMNSPMFILCWLDNTICMLFMWNCQAKPSSKRTRNWSSKIINIANSTWRGKHPRIGSIGGTPCWFNLM